MNKRSQRYKKHDENTSSLDHVLLSMLKHYGLQERYQQHCLRQDWESIVGSVIAARTTELSLRHKTLYLRISSASLRYELQTRKKEILAKVIEHIGAVDLERIMVA